MYQVLERLFVMTVRYSPFHVRTMRADQDCRSVGREE